jgi:hypothetical protein
MVCAQHNPSCSRQYGCSSCCTRFLWLTILQLAAACARAAADTAELSWVPLQFVQLGCCKQPVVHNMVTLCFAYPMHAVKAFFTGSGNYRM